MSISLKDHARFDARITKQQKLLFEKAASIGGYRNLTDFVIRTIQDKAKEIIEENEQILASQRDATIFFEAITAPAKPNKALKQAWKDYQASQSLSK
jgi:uncharacterized protein (DUF1778 family)